MKEIKIQNLKGTTDYLPEEQVLRDKITNILKSIFEVYGYMPIKTPILNQYDLLSYKYDEDAEILNETYKLTDQGNRKLGLRYDLTIPFCKVIALNKDLRMPFKRYEIGKVFRNGPVKLGRMREFYQCDVDVVGINSRMIEIEQLIMVKKAFDKLGIDILIKWNNRKLMSGLITYAGVSSDLIDKVISIIDHMEKITRSDMIREFNKINIDNNKAEEILNLFKLSLNEYNTKFKDTDNELIKVGLDEINEINDLISKYNLTDNALFSPTLARGLSIYTGIVFEFFDKKMRITSSLGGGGRYDKIITDFIDDGNTYPACGLSFGLEPIYAILKEEITNNSLVDVLIIPMDTEVECMSIATTLRDNGIKVMVEMNKKKLKKSFEFANKTNIKYVIVVGENEIKENKYTLKDMESGKQELLNIDEIIKNIKNN